VTAVDDAESIKTSVRNDWTLAETDEVYNLPLLELVFRAAGVHRWFHDPSEIQVCSLLSIKTGGCKEDCAYCPQSARYRTGVGATPLLSVEEVIEAARSAREAGATRFCMGAAWRNVKDNAEFERVLGMVRSVASLGLETCCTLGMLSDEQAVRLKEAGLHAYNHNLDTSEEFYGRIITTRTYQDRLQTLASVSRAGLTVCCGGIIGMGESHEDRVRLLHTLATLPRHPESVPINALVPVPGTPLADRPPVPPLDVVRMVAATRVLMPRSMVRLSAGRLEMSAETQTLCFLAGANSIFAGEKLLTTPNNSPDADSSLFEALGLSRRPAFKEACLDPASA
jgi:biotin synthase